MNPNRLNQFGEPLEGEPPGQEYNQQEPEENEVPREPKKPEKKQISAGTKGDPTKVAEEEQSQERERRRSKRYQ